MTECRIRGTRIGAIEGEIEIWKLFLQSFRETEFGCTLYDRKSRFKKLNQNSGNFISSSWAWKLRLKYFVSWSLRFCFSYYCITNIDTLALELSFSCSYSVWTLNKYWYWCPGSPVNRNYELKISFKHERFLENHVCTGISKTCCIAEVQLHEVMTDIKKTFICAIIVKSEKRMKEQILKRLYKYFTDFLYAVLEVQSGVDAASSYQRRYDCSLEQKIAGGEL